ncbi:MAG: hypothetical protein H8Z69_04745 [Nanohaloarchaea archaeon]|nr:hypothetical protein [Candidatus Nanohaloarchaea archaeon]
MERELNKSFLSRSLEEVDLHNIAPPQRLGRIINKDTSPTDFGADESFRGYLEDSSRYENVPRTGLRLDFWDFPDHVVDFLKRETVEEHSDEAAAGADLAGKAIEVIEDSRWRNSGFSCALLSVPLNVPETKKVNVNQYAGPSKIDVAAPIPEEYRQDDRLSQFTEDNSVGVLVDDNTVLATQLEYMMDELEDQGYEFEDLYRMGFEETVEGYKLNW